METFEDYLKTIGDDDHRLRMQDILEWIADEFPQLEERVAWSQPMFVKEDTFIIGFSTAKNHLSVAPEKAGLREFSEAIEKAGYNTTKELIQIKWTQEVDYALLRRMIAFNIEDKEGYPYFWRK